MRGAGVELGHLAVLKDKKYKLSPLGEVKVEGRDAVGVQVSCKGHKDVNLYFDKETNLLAKGEWNVKAQEQGGKEVMQETLYGDYKDVEGAKIPMKIMWVSRANIASRRNGSAPIMATPGTTNRARGLVRDQRSATQNVPPGEASRTCSGGAARGRRNCRRS